MSEICESQRIVVDIDWLIITIVILFRRVHEVSDY